MESSLCCLLCAGALGPREAVLGCRWLWAEPWTRLEASLTCIVLPRLSSACGLRAQGHRAVRVLSRGLGRAWTTGRASWRNRPRYVCLTQEKGPREQPTPTLAPGSRRPWPGNGGAGPGVRDHQACLGNLQGKLGIMQLLKWRGRDTQGGGTRRPQLEQRWVGGLGAMEAARGAVLAVSANPRAVVSQTPAARGCHDWRRAAGPPADWLLGAGGPGRGVESAPRTFK